MKLNKINVEKVVTREVKIGELCLGGKNPIRIQSMTNTDTLDIENTLKQIIRLKDSGCELVRIATKDFKEAEAFEEIQKKLTKLKIKIPLIADVHFSPAIALKLAPVAAKIRVNPGNYCETPKLINKDDALEQIRKNLSALVALCKRYGTALRIGINSGSLSRRILNEYGRTTKAMVVSAIEFIEILESLNFQNFVISLKSSDPYDFVEANRLLFTELLKCKKLYPIHIGVTEAGMGIDGIIKSAIGIGSLLSEGIGDTIRVSLTGDPVNEIKVAKNIIKSFSFNYVERDEKSFLPCNSDKIIPKVIINESNEIRNINILDLTDSSIFDKFWLAPEEYNGFFCKLYPKYKTRKEDIINFSVKFALPFINGWLSGIIVDAGKANAYYSQIAKWILQSSKRDVYFNEYISCPTCSRTSFDVLGIMNKLKKATLKYKGLKIAIMGCIVNGPGEVEDADIGCFGSGKNVVDIYVRKILVKKKVPQKVAVKEILRLIKQHFEL